MAAADARLLGRLSSAKREALTAALRALLGESPAAPQPEPSDKKPKAGKAKKVKADKAPKPDKPKKKKLKKAA